MSLVMPTSEVVPSLSRQEENLQPQEKRGCDKESGEEVQAKQRQRNTIALSRPISHPTHTSLNFFNPQLYSSLILPFSTFLFPLPILRS